ncbi:MAG: hypothetical protein KKG35_16995 [Proteobacteria bacterium]|nr:hypothetical protein [Pseudomonadota bacterium]
MLPLSEETAKKIAALFPESLRDEVRQLLEIECGDNIPFCENADEFSMERIRFAALKVSEGRLEKLLEAVILAQTDWRDLLVSADFAEDVNAHRRWQP